MLLMPTVACSAVQAGDEIVCSCVSLSVCLFGFCPHLFTCVLHEMTFLIPSAVDQQLVHICTIWLCIKQDLYMCAEDLNQSCKRESMLIINWSCLSPILF